MNRLLRVVLLLALSLTFLVPAALAEPFCLHLEGALDSGKLPVVMDLVVVGSAARGSYYYVKRGEPIPLEGTIGAELALTENPLADRPTGFFALQRSVPGWTGVWSASLDSGARALPVDLRMHFESSAQLLPVVLSDTHYAFPGKRDENCYTQDYLALDVVALPPGAAPGALARLRTGLALFAAGLDPDSAPLGDIRQTLRIFRDSGLAEYRATVEELGSETEEIGPVLQWSTEERMTIGLNERNLLVLEDDNYSYTGGAHGMFVANFAVFDLLTGKRLMLDDLFLPGWEKKLRPILKSGVLAQLSERKGEKATDEDLLVEGPFPVSRNFYVTRAGVGFHYDVYEVACYAAGTFDIVLPWTKLAKLLKPGTPLERLRR